MPLFGDQLLQWHIITMAQFSLAIFQNIVKTGQNCQQQELKNQRLRQCQIPLTLNTLPLELTKLNIKQI